MLREESIVLVIAPPGEEEGIRLHLDPGEPTSRRPGKGTLCLACAYLGNAGCFPISHCIRTLLLPSPPLEVLQERGEKPQIQEVGKAGWGGLRADAVAELFCVLLPGWLCWLRDGAWPAASCECAAHCRDQ